MKISYQSSELMTSTTSSNLHWPSKGNRSIISNNKSQPSGQPVTLMNCRVVRPGDIRWPSTDEWCGDVILGPTTRFHHHHHCE